MAFARRIPAPNRLQALAAFCAKRPLVATSAVVYGVLLGSVVLALVLSGVIT